MSKFCMNYESGEFEHIDENGYSLEQGDFTFNWDHSEYDREREEEEERNSRSSLWDDED